MVTGSFSTDERRYPSSRRIPDEQKEHPDTAEVYVLVLSLGSDQAQLQAYGCPFALPGFSYLPNE